MTAKTRKLGKFGVHIGAMIHQIFGKLIFGVAAKTGRIAPIAVLGPHQRRKTELPPAGSPVQRREAAAGRVYVRAFLDQELRHIQAAHLGGHDERGIAVNVADFHLGACGHKQGRTLDVVRARRKEQRCIVTLGKCVDIGVRLDERLHHIRMLLCDGPHQGRLALHFLRFDIRPMREKRLHAFDTPGTRRKHERCCTAIESDIRLGASR